MTYKFDEKEHLHLLDDKALTGTSSVGDVIAKPLTWWASGLAVEKFGWRDPKKNSPETLKLALGEAFERIRSLTLTEYETLVLEAYRAHSVKLKDSAKKGIDLHAELERFVKDEITGQRPEDISAYDEKIHPFIMWADQEVERFLWSEAHCFDEELWVGGISDTGVLMKDGKIAVIDFKSAKEAYTNHFIQASGYAIQIEKNGLWTPDGIQIGKVDKEIGSLIIVPFGSDKVEPVIKEDVEVYKEGFRSAVYLYRLLGLGKK